MYNTLVIVISVLRLKEPRKIAFSIQSNIISQYHSKYAFSNRPFVKRKRSGKGEAAAYTHGAQACL